MSRTCSAVACGPASTWAASPGISFMVRNTTNDTPIRTGTAARDRPATKPSTSGHRHRPESEHVRVRVDEAPDALVPCARGLLVDDKDPRRILDGLLLNLNVELPPPGVVGRAQRPLQKPVDLRIAVPAGIGVAVRRLEIGPKHPLKIDELVDAKSHLDRVDALGDAVCHVVLERLKLLFRKLRVDPDR